MSGRTHRIAFRGSISSVDQLNISESDVCVTDVAGLVHDVDDAPHVVLEHERPDHADVESIQRALNDSGASRLVAIGSGAALDAAKRAWCDPWSPTVALSLAPAGAEPWRAFAPFGVLVDAAGTQDTVVDEQMATADVLMVTDLLGSLGSHDLLLTSLDMLVCATESLLSNRSQPYSAAHAEAGGMMLIEAIRSILDGQPVAPECVVVASALVTDALSSTGLGLAHAVSTHCAGLLGQPQERINAIIGHWTLQRWEGHPRLDRLRSSMRSSCDRPLTELVCSGLEELGLAALADAGVVRGDVDLMMPRILTSSGITQLPDPLSAAEIGTIVAELAGSHEPDCMRAIEHKTEIAGEQERVFEVLRDVEARSTDMAHVNRVAVLEDGPRRRLVEMHEIVGGQSVVVTSRFVLDPPHSIAYEHVGERPFGYNRGRYDLATQGGRCVLRQIHLTSADLDDRPSLRQAWIENMKNTHQLIGRRVASRRGPSRPTEGDNQ